MHDLCRILLHILNGYGVVTRVWSVWADKFSEKKILIRTMALHEGALERDAS